MWPCEINVSRAVVIEHRLKWVKNGSETKITNVDCVTEYSNEGVWKVNLYLKGGTKLELSEFVKLEEETNENHSYKYSHLS
jgi:hypothetical protein